MGNLLIETGKLWAGKSHSCFSRIKRYLSISVEQALHSRPKQADVLLQLLCTVLQKETEDWRASTKKHFTHLTPQFSYFQAGMHHSIFPRQAEVYWSSKRGPQFLADHAYRKTYISFLHLPEGTNNHVPLSTGKQLHIFLRKCEHNTTNRRGDVGLKSKNLQTSTTPSDSYFIFPVRILPAYCIPVRAMYILRISLVPCEQTVELDLS